MTEIEATLTQYTETLALANTNLDEVPVRIRSGREAQKREAQAALETVEQAYAGALRRALYGISVTGPETDTFVSIAKEEGAVLVVDADGVYRRIADRVYPAMGASGEFGVSQFGLVIQELRAIASELNIASMPAPRWSEPVNVGSYDGLVAHIRAMVDSSVGADLLELYIRRQVLLLAIAAKEDRSTVPVVLTGDLEVSSLNRIFGDRSAVVRAVSTEKDPINKEFVLEVFSKIKKHVKSSKKTNTNTPNN